MIRQEHLQAMHEASMRNAYHALLPSLLVPLLPARRQ
jgi:hypothetical protein